jgi:NOL1/NOP2/sun family putative RNA methylase
MPGSRAASVGEVQRRLPGEFLQSLSQLLPPAAFERCLRGMGTVRATTLRVNTLKSDARELMRFFHREAVKYQRVLWYPDAFVLVSARERDVEGWQAYRDGHVYVQGLASMAPALALGPLPGESILDIAAAPGSKTTQIAALMGNRGSILANEPNAVRAEKLAYNIALQGCLMVEVTRGWGEKVGAQRPERFDRVLLDVPCSGEGRFTTAHPSTYRSWSMRDVTRCTRLQRRLLESGAAAVKPGGVLVYSTCTLNREENEKMIQWALENLPVEVERLPLQIPGSLPAVHEGLSPEIGRALRLLPDREHEGFFLCRMRRRARR